MCLLSLVKTFWRLFLDVNILGMRLQDALGFQEHKYETNSSKGLPSGRVGGWAPACLLSRNESNITLLDPLLVFAEIVTVTMHTEEAQDENVFSE